MLLDAGIGSLLLEASMALFVSKKDSIDWAVWRRSADSLGFSGIVVKPIEEIVRNTCPNPKPGGLERKIRPQKEQALNCPRLVEGTGLKEVPSETSPLEVVQERTRDLLLYHRPKSFLVWLHHQACRSVLLKTLRSMMSKISTWLSLQQLVKAQLSALELLTGISSRGLNSFIPMPLPDPNTVYTSGFLMQDFKPTLNFSLDGFGSGYGGLHGVQETTGRLLFPFEDLKQVPSNTDIEQHKEQGDSAGYWSGMLGGGSWLASLKVIHGHTMLRTQQKGNPIKYKYK
ncbi:hypothetical protein V6N11_010767 [Hibiscus sabdariffa]|uniref:Uncharacterized protein n=1 Tax=Hibiscus sabdariffa TaxID=183260 RepID=A0ABR2S6N1_9ROSI